jgi:hypothetical protein
MSFTSGQSSERSFRMVGPAVVLTEFRSRPGERERDPVLPDAGENLAAGVTVLYLLRDPGEHEVRLTFLDGAGGELRSFSAKPGEDLDPPKPEPGQPAEPRPPRRVGLNRFVWDGRRAAPAAIRIDPPKEERWAQAQGPIVPPGTYRVRLQVGDEVRTASFEIVKDPRSPAPQADLEAQYRYALRVWSRLTDLNEAVNTIRELKLQLERWSGGDDEVGAAAKALRDALTAVEDELVQVDVKGSGRLGSPDRLDGKLRVLLQQANYPARPTDAAVAVADELSGRLDAVLERLRALLDGQVAGFNDLVRRAAAPALTPNPSAAPAGAAAAAADTGEDHQRR